jgi:hypothetical protein
MKEKIHLTGLLMGPNHGCITTNPVCFSEMETSQFTFNQKV